MNCVKVIIVGFSLILSLSLPGFTFTLGGTKALGMGQAFTAVADDPSCVFWNPAGLTRAKFLGLRVSLNARGENELVDFFKAIEEEDEAAALDIAQRISAPATLLESTLDLGIDFARRLAITGCVQGEAILDTFEYEPGTRVEIKSTLTNLNSVYLTFARRFSTLPLALGGNVKYYIKGLRLSYYSLREGINPPVEVQKSSEAKAAISFDLGFLYELAKGKISLGVMGENLFGQREIEFPEMSEESLSSFTLSQRVNVGVAFEPIPWVTLAADIHNVFAEESTFHLGGEVRLPFLALRVGLDDNVLTYGAKVSIPLYALEVAYRGGDNPSFSLVLMRLSI